MELVSDEQIVELYFKRDEEALKHTEQKYKHLCFRISDNILFNKEDSEECVNDMLLRVWNAIPPTRPNNFKAFICKIVRNIALTRFEANNRKKRSREFQVSLDELGDLIPDNRLSDRFDDEEIGQAIDRFLDTLDELTQNIFIRKYWYFDTAKDIAKRYVISVSKVNHTLYSTRNKLRDHLRKEEIYI